MHTSETDDPGLSDDFHSDAARNKPARGRARRIPELQDGMSAFRTLEQARERWRDVAALARQRGEPVRIGDYVACVDLKAGLDFAYEDPGEPDGHMTIWGDPDLLAAAVSGIEPADR